MRTSLGVRIGSLDVTVAPVAELSWARHVFNRARNLTGESSSRLQLVTSNDSYQANMAYVLPPVEKWPCGTLFSFIFYWPVNSVRPNRPFRVIIWTYPFRVISATQCCRLRGWCRYPTGWSFLCDQEDKYEKLRTFVLHWRSSGQAF